MYNNLYNDADFDFLFDSLFNGRFAFLFLFFLFFFVAIIVITCIANWKLFDKAGRKGWEALIPFYNSYIYTEIAGLNWWWFLLILAPNIISFIDDDLYSLASLVNLFASFNCFYNIAKKFKKDTGTAVCAGIFSFIFMFVFAFSGKEKYYSNVKVSRNGVFNDSENNPNNSTDVKADAGVSYCIHCGAKLEKIYNFCPKCGKENK